MKPDNKITGSVESVNNTAPIDVEKNKAEIASSIQSETQPMNSSSARTVTQNDLAQQQKLQAPTSGAIQQHDSGKGNFASQIASLPAEDSEIIEKEWVDKVDEVIEKTKQDPYFQEQGQHALSRQYLKSRFNLDVE
jgi:hypothetical protein